VSRSSGLYSGAQWGRHSHANILFTRTDGPTDGLMSCEHFLSDFLSGPTSGSRNPTIQYR
jgi:hypothetical protein